MNSDSPLNWEKLANPTLPVSNIDYNYSSISFYKLTLLFLNFLFIFICILLIHKYIFIQNIKHLNDDEDYSKWN